MIIKIIYIHIYIYIYIIFYFFLLKKNLNQPIFFRWLTNDSRNDVIEIRKKFIYAYIYINLINFALPKIKR